MRRSSPSNLRCSPAVSVGGSSRGDDSSETYAEHATPKSTPQPGRPFGRAGLGPVATPKEMYQPSPSRLTVALRTTPPSGRDSRNRTHPTFGSHTCPHLRFSFWTLTAWPGKLSASQGQLEALCVGSQRHPAVAVEVLPLLHCQVPNRPTGMSPPGRHLYLVPSPDPDA